MKATRLHRFIAGTFGGIIVFAAVAVFSQAAPQAPRVVTGVRITGPAEAAKLGWVDKAGERFGLVQRNTENRPWLLGSVTPNMDMGRIVEVTTGLTARLNTALIENAELPEVAPLFARFRERFNVTVFNPNVDASMLVMKAVDESGTGGFDPTAIEVVFFGKDGLSSPRIGGNLLKYDTEWKALMVAALDYDRSWFQALSLHELCHGLIHDQGNPSSTAAMGSALYVAEELTCHGTENAVLNRQTAGKYGMALTGIVSASRQEDVQSFLANLDPKALLEMDGLFQKPTPQESGLRSAQYMLDLGRTWLQRRLQGDELKQAEIDLFRRLTRTS